MTKLIHKMLILFIMIGSTTIKVNAQSSVIGNNGLPFPNAYLGWDAFAPQDLSIRHDAARNINFSTNGLPRMVINGAATGFVGIGQNFTTPTSVLSVSGLNYITGNVFETDGNATQLTQWRFSRGATQRARFFNPTASEAFHMESTRGDIIFDANGNVGAGTGPFQRMRISSGAGVAGNGNAQANQTKVIIEKGQLHPVMTIPVGILNLGTNNGLNPFSAGGRAWMDVGTYSMFSSDNMYVGLKSRPGGADNFDAAINWGDNSQDPAFPGLTPDNLRFIYTSTAGQNVIPVARDFHGLEVGRFTPQGFYGIGNFAVNGNGNGSGVQPARKLEVYDQSLFNGIGLPAAPQLRLTFAPNANIALV